ncbi:carbohydrate ABC transporter substrate-binding protein [Romboutsia weinsteinii]|uniref:Carbohydrate ABC transporter substrate-binding protein n=1 Tax=Romboutsia weinsteinii TaxID=2020949 RepID=A0A371IXC3_9FIRM|nr:ABC transporter substrate-binding protein [Romboutsia weinsteinii]RDY25120.1 carbohydrate ABC transporter substrate-binding protein [Romboutsia weinsteinii]
MKKIISLALVTGLMLSGCAKGSADGSKGEGKIAGEITVVTDRTDADDLFEEIEANFKKKYPDVTDIKWESSSDYNNHISTRMNTKDYGDVLFVPFVLNATPQEYSNYFEPLGSIEELEKEYMDVTEADHDSTVYGLPSRLNSLGIIYNKEVLKKAGIENMPTTMEEMMETLQAISDNTDAIPLYTNYNTLLGMWGGALTSFGGEQYRSDMLKEGTAFEKGQPIREVMDLFYNISSKGLIEEDPITGDPAKSFQMLANGEVAMLMSGSQDVPVVQGLSTDKENIDIAPFPVKLDGETSIAYGADSVVGINKNSKNVETAKAFLEFFISAESGYAEESNGIPTKKADFNDEQKKIFEDYKIILTAPTDTPEEEALYQSVANEVGVGRLKDTLQKVINIGLYPNENESYEEFVNNLEVKWSKALKNNEK